MSYIIDNTNGFVSVKLTDTGRELLAKGQLTFNSWALGDSEVNYLREEIVEDNPGDVAYSATTKNLRPKDMQPSVRYYVTTGATTFNPITSANLNVVKAVVNNKANERGFFSGTTGTTYVTRTSSDYIKATNSIASTSLSGGTIIDLGVSGATVGDFVVFRVTNDTLGALSADTNDTPVPYLWFKVQDFTGNTIEVDRVTPDLSAGSAINTQLFVYGGGEIQDTFGTGNTTSYWDNGTLSFSSGCNVTNDDVPIWNMNIPFSEDIPGITGSTYEDYSKFGSFDYVGTKDPYLGYSLNEISGSTLAKVCEGFSSLDGAKKSVAILHYTNNAISNLYGESFYVDTDNDKTVRVHVPTLMYNRIGQSTGYGTKLGMSFEAAGKLITQTGTDITYYELYEDDTIVADPIVVGRVYPQLKIIVFTDEEIVAAMSYKSNRNWTLPALDATLTPASGGTTSGILPVDKVMYLTYVLESTSGLTYSLPCQKYTIVQNTSNATKDVEFNIEDIDLLPLMRKIETAWDGKGFYAHNFKLLYQIVDKPTTRPSSGAWKEVDFTSTAITTVAGQTIDPTLLERQNPASNGFILNATKVATAVDYESISKLTLAPNTTPNLLQFGDERFFYGNVDAYIGATIYKTIFVVNASGADFIQTTNPTRTGTIPTNIRVSEIGIYDSNQNLVLIGKLSRPVELLTNRTITFELSIDF